MPVSCALEHAAGSIPARARRSEAHRAPDSLCPARYRCPSCARGAMPMFQLQPSDAPASRLPASAHDALAARCWSQPSNAGAALPLTRLLTWLCCGALAGVGAAGPQAKPERGKTAMHHRRRHTTNLHHAFALEAFAPPRSSSTLASAREAPASCSLVSLALRPYALLSSLLSGSF